MTRVLTLIANGPKGELHDPLDGNTFLADVVAVLAEVARTNPKVAVERVSTLAAVLEVLKDRPAERLQLVGHGGRGELELGCSWDCTCFVPEVRSGSAIRAWLMALPQVVTEVYLVGCDVGAGDLPGQGHELLRDLAGLTSAAVYAATGPALACLFDEISGTYRGAMSSYDPVAKALVHIPPQRTCPPPIGPQHPLHESPQLHFTHLRYQRRPNRRLLEEELDSRGAATLASCCHLTAAAPDGGCLVQQVYSVEVAVGEKRYFASFEVLSGDRGRLRPAGDAPLPPELLALRWNVRQERSSTD